MSSLADAARRAAAVRPGDGLVRIGMAELLAMRAQAHHLTLKSLARHAQQSGARRSPFRARGMDYEESRRYQVGDDMRSLDWRVMARTGHPFTKLFREERERPVFVCVDLGASMFFATRGAFKAVVAARSAALLGWAVLEHGDRVGGVVFGGPRQWERRPRRGKHGVLGLLHDLSDSSNWDDSEARETVTLQQMASRIARVARPGSLVVIISDFVSVDTQALNTLTQIAAHSDLLNLLVYDPLESELPAPGRYPIADGARRFVLDTWSNDARNEHQRRFAARRGQLETLYARCGARLVSMATTDEPATVLATTLRGALR